MTEARRKRPWPSISGRLRRLRPRSASGEAEQAQLKAQSAVISERLAGISQEKIALEAERTAKSRAGQEMNETLLNLERAASRLETKLTTSAMEEKQILDKLWETYELNHSDAQAQRIELESVPKASRRVAELKREINGLGTINVGAIDEFERVNGRYTYPDGSAERRGEGQGRADRHHWGDHLPDD